ncbi:unnamed protein product, partial [marine sediment metagenome]
LIANIVIISITLIILHTYAVIKRERVGEHRPTANPDAVISSRDKTPEVTTLV